MKDAPPPPPETVDAYAKKDSSGPTALIDKLKNDLEKDMQANEHDEQDSQKEYERFMSDSVAKRTADSKSITEKEGQKAELEADLMAARDIKKTKANEHDEQDSQKEYERFMSDSVAKRTADSKS